MNQEKYDKIMAICFRRGVFYPASEIHNPPAGFFDYGSVGAMIKRKFEDYWRKYFLKSLEEPFYEIDTSNIMPEPVFTASGHLKAFVDPITECRKCGLIERADHILESHLKTTFEGLSMKELDELIKKHSIKCHECGGELKEVTTANMMFGFPIGLSSEKRGYLRPETAQGSYVSFKREYGVNREKLPLGLAIIGRVYRNEISPRQGLYRLREFNQAELQIFFDPDKASHPRFEEVKDFKVSVVLANEREKGIQRISCEKLAEKYLNLYVYFMARVQQFYESLSVPLEKFRFYEKNEEERAFYNKIQFDAEIDFDSYAGFREVMGLHYRSDYDLRGHQKVSKKDLTITRQGKKFIPHVVELSFGIDRSLFAFLDLFYTEKGKRVFFSLPKQISPYTAGVYPLVSKDGLDEKAKQVYDLLKKDFDVFYDDNGSIGRRYARADEIGINLSCTVDYQTMKDNTLTIRERDSTKQIRVRISELPTVLQKFLKGEEFAKLGKIL